MAAPIIQPLVFDPPVGTFGQETLVTVLANDPAHTVTRLVTVTVADSDGSFSARTDPHEVQGGVQDLTYGPMTSDEPNDEITQDPNVPNEFTLIPAN